MSFIRRPVCAWPCVPSGWAIASAAARSGRQGIAVESDREIVQAQLAVRVRLRPRARLVEDQRLAGRIARVPAGNEIRVEQASTDRLTAAAVVLRTPSRARA